MTRLIKLNSLRHLEGLLKCKFEHIKYIHDIHIDISPYGNEVGRFLSRLISTNLMYINIFLSCLNYHIHQTAK